MKEETKKLATELQIERLNYNIEKIMGISPILEELAKGSKDLREQVTNEITKFALSIRASKLDKSELNNFFTHPYHVYQQKGDNQNTWHLAIPRFIDAQFGWLEKVTESHNIFVVNPYVDWLGEIPEALKQKVGMKDPLDVYLDGDVLSGRDIDKVKMKLKDFIKKEEKGKLIMDKTRHFEFIVALIKEGILPFTPKPVDKSDLTEMNHFTEEWELLDYHYEAWEKFLQYSNIGYFLPPSGGKTFLSIYALGKIRGPHLVCVPSVNLREQWMARLEANTDLKVGEHVKEGLDVVIMTYQSAIKHAHKFSWQLVVIDEVHHLPANLFSKLATITRKYLIGLTATPQREDGREEYIFALTGKPCGLSWQKMKDLGIITNIDLHVHIVKNEKERWQKLDELMQESGQTIIFSDRIKMGEEASKRYNLKFVHGSSKLRIKDIPMGESFVSSRVGDEGISLPKIKRVIEIDWLHGSRRQELQRFTRILHGKTAGGVGHIIMTIEQYQTDRKRLFGVMEKGFKIVLHREGFSDKKIIEASYDKPRKVKTTRAVKLKIGSEMVPSKIDLGHIHPILGLPGVKRKLIEYNTAEIECLKIMYANVTTEYTKEDLCYAVGIGRPKDFANFKKLAGDRLVKPTKKSHYMANLDLSKVTK